MNSDYLKTFPQYVLPKHTLTTFAGLLANVTNPTIKNRLIQYFIKRFDVNMSEAREENPEKYSTFNEFFIRQLKPECRPIANADIISPVDGYISEIGQIHSGQVLQAKGHHYSVQELLACDAEKGAQFDHGLFATLYLSPQDYHRVHMPLEATLKSMTYVPGKLFSVQPTTARVIPRLFACNERLVVLFDTCVGLMAMVLVGATIVGAIGTSWHGDIIRNRKSSLFTYPKPNEVQPVFPKAAEMGYFKLGSTVILLFAEGKRIAWQNNLHPGNKIQFGQPLGSFNQDGVS